MGDEEPLKSLQGLFVEDDMINFINRESAIIQTKSYGLNRKARVVFESRKPFFLRGGDNFAIDHKRCGRVVEVGTDADDFHQNIFSISSMVKVVCCACFQPHCCWGWRSRWIKEKGGTTTK